MFEERTSGDKYYTIEGPKRAEIKVKGSKFIATSAPAKTKDEALEFLDTIRSEFHDATHNCFAYRIGHEGLEFRAADDGEPNGSAGKPILFTISKYDFSDIIVIVTRYFGGTKLGVGGLARAYSESAEEALKLCKPKEVHLVTAVKVFCTYEDISPVKKLIEEMSVTFSEFYGDSVEFEAKLPNSRVEEFTKRITGTTAGRAGTRILEPEIFRGK
ncbi:MAG: IMPACT family protein [Bacteroidota bacterium]